MHGDSFDPIVQHSPWLASIGSTAYEMLLVLNRWCNFGRRTVKREYRSISSWLKHQVKVVVNYMGRFEEAVALEADTQRVDGLICGHIHRACIREINSVLYTNAGDWVESCTALAENAAGQLGIIEWRNHQPLHKAIAEKEYEDLYRNRCLASAN
jgi:UDP-2,3-diacylglucosamine pyrophosphatase LpxH